MVVNKKGESTSAKTSDRPIHKFYDNEKVKGMLNYFFHLVITTTIIHFDISWILINGGSFCDIIYSKLFEEMGLNKENLWPYEGFDLQVFNDTITCLWGYIKLIIFIGEGKYIRIVD